MQMRPPVYARRCEILAAFEHSRYLPERERLKIARRHGVGRDRIADDLKKLREAGCLELRGARGCYHWMKPYQPPVKIRRKKPETTRRNCMCCNTEFDSEGIHNRLCDDCRRLDDGLSSYRVIR